MNLKKWLIFLPKAFAILLTVSRDLVTSLKLNTSITRRDVFWKSVGTSSFSSLSQLMILLGPVDRNVNNAGATSDDDLSNNYSNISYETRNRRGNRDALIAEDYWYMTGRLPPRVLDATPTNNNNNNDQTTTAATYVSLNQRRPAYAKFAISIDLGINSYKKLGNLLNLMSTSTSNSLLWDEASKYLQPASPGTLPSPIMDARIKMLLFATGMLTSPNNSGTNMEYLVARFYVNELDFATKEMSLAFADQNLPRATAAWQFGKDSWNSYLTIINRAIAPKVGDKFKLIS